KTCPLFTHAIRLNSYPVLYSSSSIFSVSEPAQISWNLLRISSRLFSTRTPREPYRSRGLVTTGKRRSPRRSGEQSAPVSTYRGVGISREANIFFITDLSR